MIKHNLSNLPEFGFLLMLENSLRAIPFNFFIAALLSADLLYNKVSINLLLCWVAAVFLISIIRWVHSKMSINNAAYISKRQQTLTIFLGLTALMGSVWGMGYLLFLPQIDVINEVMVILVLGGMAAGSIASLSIYIPAYYAYVLPMFLPVIVYNFYIHTFERVILASMFLLFVIMVIWTAKINSHLIYKTFKLGKEKDLLIGTLEQTNQRLEESLENIKILSITDSLTGIYNRRCFDKSIMNEFNRSKRNQYSLNLIFIDIDNFKRINDEFGHPTGDDFLVSFAQLLQSNIRRANDSVFRIGGDEFAIILANLEHENAQLFCKRLQEQFKEHCKYDDVTLSIGQVFIPANYEGTIETLINEADQTLYLAKKQGKNQVCSKALKHELV